MEQKMPENNKESQVWWGPAVAIFSEVAGWIAGPIIAALFIGKWLDQKYHTSPWLFLLSMGLAFFISSFGIIKITLNYIKNIEREAKQAKELKEKK